MPPNPFRTGFVALEEDGARLGFAQPSSGAWTVHYTPAPEALKIAQRVDNTFVAPKRPILLLRGDAKSDLITSYPLNTTASSRSFLQPKYATLRTITFDGFCRFSHPDELVAVEEWLLTLPSGFVKTAYFGLGLKYELRYLIETIEQVHGVTDLHLRRGPTAGLPTVTGASYITAAKSFDDARKSINRIHDKALTVASDEKEAVTHNALLTPLDPKRFPEKARRYRKDAILDAIGKSLARTVVLSTSDRRAVVDATILSAKRVRKDEPEALLALSREIEVVTLEDLLNRMKTMLGKKLSEARWQDFFVENPFILRLAFGLPIMMVADQVSVGGRKFTGRGEKISDFAVRAAASGNLALIEIKTPDTTLLETGEYRGGLHAPSRELSGSVNQILDQRYQLQRSVAILKDTSGVWDVESYAVQGLVIAGRTPTGKPQLKSFELFRNALKSVTVITFDELVAKLEHLLEVLGDSVLPEAKAPDTALADAE